ncbi:MAG: nucleoside hydrolase, partial [Lachnospiraceae bacterium]|nr:nucleoside hydrolase [Lachnospiraceae bacterium]
MMEKMDIKEKMIYDGDPGHDDVMAILLAAGSPGIDLLGVTTVAGNAPLEMTTRNALITMDIIGADIPVAAGCRGPLVRPLYTAPFVHGKSGLDGAKLFEPKRKPVEKHACDFLIDTLMESDGDISIVAAGPLTNVALALRREPAIEEKIKQLVIMGGGRFGNITPAAEFNIWSDAEAARIVFESGIPKVMCGLDLTYQAVATPEIMKRIQEIHSPVSEFVNDFMSFYNANSKRAGKNGAPVNDACCVAYLIDHKVFTTRHLRVDIETKGELP